MRVSRLVLVLGMFLVAGCGGGARHPQPAASFYEITVAGGNLTAAKELYRP